MCHQVLTVKLVLDDVVEDFEEEEDEVVVGRAGVQEPGRAEGLRQREGRGLEGA